MKLVRTKKGNLEGKLSLPPSLMWKEIDDLPLPAPLQIYWSALESHVSDGRSSATDGLRDRKKTKDAAITDDLRAALFGKNSEDSDRPSSVGSASSNKAMPLLSPGASSIYGEGLGAV